MTTTISLLIFFISFVIGEFIWLFFEIRGLKRFNHNRLWKSLIKDADNIKFVSADKNSVKCKYFNYDVIIRDNIYDKPMAYLKVGSHYCLNPNYGKQKKLAKIVLNNLFKDKLNNVAKCISSIIQ